MSESSSSPGPTLPPGPAPNTDTSNSRKRSRSPPPSPEKRQRTIGPTLPPPEQLNDGSDSNDSDDDSDDDFGPQLPSAANTSSATAQSNLPDPSAYPPSEPATKPAAKRDEWMLLPPKQDDLSSRVDPTKLKSRGFNTGKGSKAPIAKGESGGMWTETAEEKRRRLQNEVMGVQEAPPAGRKAAGPAGGPAPEDAHSRETARKVEEYNQKARNTTLYKQHNKKSSKQGDGEKEKEDDPSARPFDKEKDIRGPSKISHAQRREMVTKATDFSSRFDKGKFL